MSAVQTNGREDQLLLNVRSTLEAKNYGETPVIYKGSVSSSNTHSLRELLIASSVNMEATSETNVTALCTIDVDPSEIIESFERLMSFSEEDGNAHKSEIAQVIFPVFVHIYLDFVSNGHADVAQNFYNKYFSVVSPIHQWELNELSEIVTSDQLVASPLARKFKKQKFCLRMSNQAFQMLIQFLQVCQTPVLFNLIQKHLTIEVYGNTPLANGDLKTEQKKASQTLTFIKPRIPQLQTEDRLQSKRRKEDIPSRPLYTTPGGYSPSLTPMASPGITMATSDSYFEGKYKPLQRKSSASTPAHSTTHLSDFRENLAVASHFDPSPPSVSLFSVQGGPLSVHCASLSGSPKLFCCGLSDSSIHIWSQLPGETNHMTNSHQPIGLQRIRTSSCTTSSVHHILLGHFGPVYGTCFNATGQHLLSASEDCCVRLWDVQKHRCLVCYRGHAYPVWDVTFCPVDVYFATASYDKTARLWASDTNYPLRIFAGHTAGVDAVRFHPNGKYIATGSSDNTCRLWDIHSGQCVRLMTGGKSAVGCVAFSPNGKLMVSGGEDGVIQMWDLGSGFMMKEFKGHSEGITSLAYSPDGTLLASACHRKQIRVWNVNTSASQSAGSQDTDVISLHPTPNTLVLNLQFTHRNCLVAIGTTLTTPITHPQN